MEWYKDISKYMDEKVTYSYREILNMLKTLKENLSLSTYRKAIKELVETGTLIKKGYNTYALSSNMLKDLYIPSYSNIAKKVMKDIENKFPYVEFTVFETGLMNDFLNHLVSQNTIFLQVEKGSSIYVFRYLQEKGKYTVMYKPNEKEFNLYWSNNCIVVIDMVSEAPLRTEDSHSITLEKMVVDISADKIINKTYSKSEFPSIMEQVQELYSLDKIRTLRYARRRNKGEVMKKYLLEGNEYAITR